MGFIEIDDGDEANPTQRKPVVIVYGAQGSDDDGFVIRVATAVTKLPYSL